MLRVKKRYLHEQVFERIFNNISNDTLVNRLCSCVSPVSHT